MDDSDDSEIDFPKSTAQKSPGKKKRKKSLIPKDGKTYAFDLKISESNAESFSEFNWLDLVSRKEILAKKAAMANGDVASNGLSEPSKPALDPYASDDEDDLKAMAAKFEQKYGGPPTKKKKKCKRAEYEDLGDGYDEEDPFIDNSECFDELVPKNVTTAHGGFYINVGALEFKENKDAVYSVSDDSSEDEKEEKKKLTKKQLKKQGDGKKVKFNEPKKKAKMINTKGPRIITTDKNKTGPKFVKNGIKKARVIVTDLKKKTGEKSPPVSKAMSKPPEIIDLEAQLNALSGDGDICITNVVSKTSPALQNVKTGVLPGSTIIKTGVSTAITPSKAGITANPKAIGATAPKAGIPVNPKASGSVALKSVGSTTIIPLAGVSTTSKPSNSIKSKMNLPSNLDVTITTVAKPGANQPSKLSVGSQPAKVATSNASVTSVSISQTASAVGNQPATVSISKAAPKTPAVVNKQAAVNITKAASKPPKEINKSKQTEKETKPLIPQLHDLSTSISLAIANPTVSSIPMDLSMSSPSSKPSYKTASMYQHDPAALLQSHMASSPMVTPLTSPKETKNYQSVEAHKLKGPSPLPATPKTIAQESRPAKNITPVAKVQKTNKSTPKSIPGGVVNVRNAPITTPKTGKSTAPRTATPVNRKSNTPHTAPLSVLPPISTDTLLSTPISPNISVTFPSQPLPPSSFTSISNAKSPSSGVIQSASTKNASSSQSMPSQQQLSSFQETFAQNLNFREESTRQQLSGSELSQLIGRQAAQAALTNQQKNSVKPRQTSAKTANTASLLQPSTVANMSAAAKQTLTAQSAGTVAKQPKLDSQIAAAHIKPSSTSKPIKPEQSKKVTSSSEGANNPGLALTPDITNSLLGFAQSMVNNLEQQQLSSPLPASAATPQQWAASGATVPSSNQKSDAVAASKAALDYIAMQNQPQQLQTQSQAQLVHQQQAVTKKTNGYDITSLLNQQVPAQMSMAKPRTKTSTSSRIPSTPLTQPLPGPPSLPSASSPNRLSPQMPLMSPRASPTVQMTQSPQVTPQLPQMSPQHLAQYQQQYADLYGLSVTQQNYMGYQ